MKEIPFSTVSYKQDITIKDLLEVEKWVEKHLKKLAQSNTRHRKEERQRLYDMRSGVSYVHFIKVYKDHKRALEKMKNKL